MAQTGVDGCLAADMQLGCQLVEFIQHFLRDIDADAGKRLFHFSLIGEEARDVEAAVGHVCDFTGGGTAYGACHRLG